MSDPNAHDPATQRARNEDCRREVRARLAERPYTAEHAHQLQRGLKFTRRSDWVLEEIESALAFLTATDPQQVKRLQNGMGATLYYQITAAGTLAHEQDPLA